MQTLTLDKLAIGQKATITTVGGEGILRRRFRYGTDPQNQSHGT